MESGHPPQNIPQTSCFVSTCGTSMPHWRCIPASLGHLEFPPQSKFPVKHHRGRSLFGWVGDKVHKMKGHRAPGLCFPCWSQGLSRDVKKKKPKTNPLWVGHLRMWFSGNMVVVLGRQLDLMVFPSFNNSIILKATGQSFSFPRCGASRILLLILSQKSDCYQPA